MSARGWSVWWDRKIPLEKSFDEVIEKALGESKCVIVLWSSASVVSEWVKSEASEAKRRNILVPVFLEAVDAPLPFSLLNGADLHDWQAGTPHGEFDKLVERVAELLGKPQSFASIESVRRDRSQAREQPSGLGRYLPWARLSAGFIAVAAIAVAAIFIYDRYGHQPDPPKNKIAIDTAVPGTQKTSPESDLEKALKGLGGLGGSVPATAVTTAFHVPDLGLALRLSIHSRANRCWVRCLRERWSWRLKAVAPLREPVSMFLISLKRSVAGRSTA